MSLRVMRKVIDQQQKSATGAAGVAGSGLVDEDGDEEEEGLTAKSTKSNFGVLWSELDVEDDADGDEDDAGEAHVSGPTLGNEPSASTSKKSKKKKKTKKKQKDKSKNNGQDTTAFVTEKQEGDLLSRLNIAETSGDARPSIDTKSPRGTREADSSPKPGSQGLRKLLLADPGLLRAEDELKRIFGAKVMREVDRQEAAAGGAEPGRGALPVPRPGARQLGNKRQGRVSAGRKFILVQPLDSWPPVDKGSLTMEQVKRPGTESDLLWFQYKESGDYTRVTKMLEECVETHDPNVMVNLVARHPSHAEGLMALSDVYRHVGEAQAGAELLERALYVLESAWHPYFNPVQGNCRLDYAWEPNQTMFLALFRNIQQLSRRGCHRAAFECAKLLLSLNPEEDPQGMLLCIDYYALRAEELDWLEDFVEAQSKKSLSILPNYSFSLALVQFQREEKEGKGHEQSAELLQDALLLHPYVLPLIVKKAPIQVNPDWTKVLKAKPFATHHKISPTLDHLSTLYSERSSLLWRPTAVQKWLKDVASCVTQTMGQGGDMDQNSANWACVRQETFTEATNEYRHLLVADFSDSVSTVPPEILMGNGGAQGEALDHVPGDPGGQRGPMENLEGRNPLAVFLETLLPWNDYGVDPNQQQQPE